MRGALVIVGVALIYGGLWWLRRPGKGGRFGAVVRRSDALSARLEVNRLRARADALNARANAIEAVPNPEAGR